MGRLRDARYSDPDDPQIDCKSGKLDDVAHGKSPERMRGKACQVTTNELQRDGPAETSGRGVTDHRESG